jgi:catechol 2,3-dioxygenase-like lactoylglutathione lyase family enzyme
MIDHVIITVSEFERSKAFYDRALAALGMTATAEFPWGPSQARGVGFGGEDTSSLLSKVRRSSRRSMWRFVRRRGQRCKRFTAMRLLPAVATTARQSLVRNIMPTISAYVFDPDGHDIEAVCYEPE